MMEVADRVIKRQRTRDRRDALATWRCGWCKGFIHEEAGAVRRYVHDEKPRTEHEVLPYRVG